HLNGEYGVKDLYVGVPAVIGAKGVERIVEIELKGAERSMLDKSVGAVRGLVDACIKIAPSLGWRAAGGRISHGSRRRAVEKSALDLRGRSDQCVVYQLRVSVMNIHEYQAKAVFREF